MLHELINACIAEGTGDYTAIDAALTQADADTLKAQDKDGNTILHLAVADGALLQHLLNKLSIRPLIDLKNSARKTALHLACQHNNQTAVEILLQHDADADLSDKDLRFPDQLTTESTIKKMICTHLKVRRAKYHDFQNLDQALNILDGQLDFLNASFEYSKAMLEELSKANTPEAITACEAVISATPAAKLKSSIKERYKIDIAGHIQDLITQNKMTEAATLIIQQSDVWFTEESHKVIATVNFFQTLLQSVENLNQYLTTTPNPLIATQITHLIADFVNGRKIDEAPPTRRIAAIQLEIKNAQLTIRALEQFLADTQAAAHEAAGIQQIVQNIKMINSDQLHIEIQNIYGVPYNATIEEKIKAEKFTEAAIEIADNLKANVINASSARIAEQYQSLIRLLIELRAENPSREILQAVCVTVPSVATVAHKIKNSTPNQKRLTTGNLRWWETNTAKQVAGYTLIAAGIIVIVAAIIGSVHTLGFSLKSIEIGAMLLSWGTTAVVASTTAPLIVGARLAYMGHNNIPWKSTHKVVPHSVAKQCRQLFSC